jgi:hypothetical protein
MAHQEPPAAAAAAVAAEPPAPPEGVVGPPCTYRALYADANRNPAPDRVAGFLAGYRFSGEGDIPTPALLRDQTVALSDRQPMAFLCLVPGQDGVPEVAVVHRLLRYVDTPGEEASGFHDRVLGLLGDIMPHQYPAVEVPSTTFHLIGSAVRVATVAAMEAIIPTWNDPHIPLGPYNEVDPDTEVICPRNTQLVPCKYAAILIHRRRLKAKQAYQELVGAIRADGALESCPDVLAWLRAACTARGGVGVQSGIPSVLHPLTPVHLPPEVYQYVTQKVQSDLPGIGTTAGTVPESTATLVGALRALTRGVDGDDGFVRTAREPKTIAEAYKETHRVLLRFCNVENVNDVAPVWKRLANCHKGEQQTLLTQELQKVCGAKGLSTALYVPVVTTTLKQMIVGLQFAGHSADDLGTGCQPFLLAYAGKAHHMQVTAASAVADQLSQGEHSATLADIRTIREGEKIKFPLNLSEVCITLYRYAVLCHMLFQGSGPAHPFVQALWDVAKGLQNIAPFVTDKYNELAGMYDLNSIYYAHIVRAVQVLSHEYLHGVATKDEDNVEGVPVPNFSVMLVELTRGTFRNSTHWIDLPMEYTAAVTGRPPMVTAPTLTNHAASTVSTASSSQPSGRSTVSALTTATAPAARVVNPAPDAEFAAITLRPGRSREIFREHPPPRNDAGHEMCVAWWTRSGCFPNCGKRNTHCPFANAGERTRMLAFVREHLAATPA